MSFQIQICEHFLRREIENNHQCKKTNSKKHGQTSKCVLEVCQDIIPLSGHTVIEQSEGQAVEVAEAMLVGMVAVVPSLFAVNTQVPLT